VLCADPPETYSASIPCPSNVFSEILVVVSLSYPPAGGEATIWNGVHHLRVSFLWPLYKLSRRKSYEQKREGVQFVAPELTSHLGSLFPRNYLKRMGTSRTVWDS